MWPFHYVKKFRLDCLNKKFYNEHIDRQGPLGVLFERHLLSRKILDISSFLENKLLGGDWIAFRNWYLVNEDYLVFRVIRGYSITTLRYVIKTGNDKREDFGHDSTGLRNYVDYGNYGVRPHEFIYASPRLIIGWDASAHNRSKNILILAYDSRLLKTHSRDDLFILKEGVNSFKQALSAIIIMHQKF